MPPIMPNTSGSDPLSPDLNSTDWLAGSGAAPQSDWLTGPGARPQVDWLGVLPQDPGMFDIGRFALINSALQSMKTVSGGELAGSARTSGSAEPSGSNTAPSDTWRFPNPV